MRRFDGGNLLGFLRILKTLLLKKKKKKKKKSHLSGGKLDTQKECGLS
jgi:hypothetical protein